MTLSDNNGIALYPDAVTTRGQKHLQELIDLQRNGFTTEMVYVVQRQDCSRFQPADDIDPEYGRLLRLAQEEGVKITALKTQMSPSEISLTGEVLDLNF